MLKDLLEIHATLDYQQKFEELGSSGQNQVTAVCPQEDSSTLPCSGLFLIASWTPGGKQLPLPHASCLDVCPATGPNAKISSKWKSAKRAIDLDVRRRQRQRWGEEGKGSNSVTWD